MTLKSGIEKIDEDAVTLAAKRFKAVTAIMEDYGSSEPHSEARKFIRALEAYFAAGNPPPRF